MFASLRSVAVVVAILALPGFAAAAQKAALVIGNAAYANVRPLTNPVNDADDMATALRRMGYSVTLVKDGDLAAMNDGLRGFLQDAKQADSAIVYYSGHGMQVKGESYLLPVSANIKDELDVDGQTVSVAKLSQLLDAAAPKVKIVILDSCRDNPLIGAGARSLGGTRGLARLDLNDTTGGTLVAYATKPGAVAADGTGRNSPFTTALLAHMETPDLDVRRMFALVRKDVVEETKGAQFPLVDDGIIGDFAMVGQSPDPGTVKPVTTPKVETPVVETPVVETPQVDARQQASLDPAPQPEATRKPQIREFVFPDSNVRQLTWEELSGLSGSELRVARNELYARHGYIFKDQQLARYFGQFDWYVPSTPKVVLRGVELRNANLIQQVEGSR